MISSRYISTRIAAITLSDGDIRAAVARAKSGDESAMQTVIAATIRYVVKQAMGYDRPDIVDDLVQEGILGVMTAIDRFDPDKACGASFLTYASYWVRWRMTEYAYRARAVFVPQRKRGPGDVKTIRLDAEDDVGDGNMHDVIAADDATPDAEYRDRVDRAAAMEFLDALPANEREAVVARYCGGKRTWRVIAAEQGCAQEIARQRVARGIWRMRRMAEKGVESC
jgi:RNA polymerase sigma factor (sigma-70 family)